MVLKCLFPHQTSNCDRDQCCRLGFEIFHYFTSWETQTQTADCRLHFTQRATIRAAAENTKQDLHLKFNLSLDGL